MIASDRHALTPWTAEFTDPRLEADYRRYVLPRTAGQLQTSLLVIALLFTLLGMADYLLLGASPTFFLLLALRVLVAIACLLTWRALRRRPARVFRFLPLNPVLWLGCLVIILIVPLRADSIGTHASATAVAVMALYLFVPNRLPWMIAASLLLSLGFLSAMLLWAAVPAGVILIQAVVLLFANTVGLITARRLARLQREQYASLLDERASSERLRHEIGDHLHLEERLRHMAGTDELTGLDNRRRFFERADQELRRALRHGSPLSFCMVDIDHFKAINDQHGHSVGDLVLTRVAATLRGDLREVDFIGRFGGEEFVIALPGADPAAAREVAERLRSRISELPHPDPGVPHRMSVTIGIARLAPGETTLDPVLKRADQALYRGKAGGRNTVVLADEQEGVGMAAANG
ncbi:GGDEF domain-containing protein [Halomonas maura]|uniref:GGDEF domain-containing protein n=1 Tax=Halomonas maura TaxID=117606 RepID=UPI0025B3B03B|nr:GGDEF domain-containing protein [Halomonas maura]MDN3556772.1 GGDEF domain-containing protein [Halomonas maura]